MWVTVRTAAVCCAYDPRREHTFGLACVNREEGPMSGFEFNDKAMKKLARDVANDVGKKFQAELDRIARSNKGRPVPDVKRQVLQAMKRTGVDAPDATATGYATAISEGTRLKVDVQRIK